MSKEEDLLVFIDVAKKTFPNLPVGAACYLLAWLVTFKVALMPDGSMTDIPDEIELDPHFGPVEYRQLTEEEIEEWESDDE